MADQDDDKSTLFQQEEAALNEARGFLTKLRGILGSVEAGESVDSATLASYLGSAASRLDTLIRDLRTSIRHQRQLMRHSDRSQEALRQAKEELATKSQRLEELNEQLSSEIEQRKSLEQQLRDLATTDSLTGLAGRRHFMDLASQEVAHSHRYATPLAALILDIDHFKYVNDTYGHAVGDEVLIAVAQRLTSGLRSADIVGRLGGEEFACVLPETDAAGAAQLGERLRQNIAAEPVPVEDPIGALTVTVSLGYGELGDSSDGLEALLQRCDQGLYCAKEYGRNCCQAA